MKHFKTLSITLAFACYLLSGCNNSSKKEQELRERELAVKEKELALKEKDSMGQKNKPATNLQVTQKPKPNNKPDIQDGYNFAGHSNFKIFWEDFKKAVNAGDKDAVAQMTVIPFKDKYWDANHQIDKGLGNSLAANSMEEFKLNYNKIIEPGVIKDINSNKYIGWEKRIELANTFVELKKGEYILDLGEKGLKFDKIKGTYKLVCILGTVKN